MLAKITWVPFSKRYFSSLEVEMTMSARHFPPIWSAEFLLFRGVDDDRTEQNASYWLWSNGSVVADANAEVAAAAAAAAML
jgi:hypothetical protein